ncbi:MAG TPA: iron-sulfur cluster assembly accessory protein [Candidatus Dormibacteraeota bacterium]|jgi:iron-sulfur cluster assembly accessory protein|nr:iron-sulfur cluster assembly accessory protein [Candidatus Dormibacteraeota bacterium]
MAIDTQLITLTNDAVGQLRTMIERKGNPNLGLRVWVQPGGCSGFSYGMALDDAPLSDDVISEVEGLKVIVDTFSAGHLQGAKVDYVDSLMGAGFTVLNPNAVSSCGCGHSFESAQGGGDAHACGSGGCAH